VAILQATNDLLHESGLDSFSIEAVAARAGVGKQTIYRWWPNRAILVADALLDRDNIDPVPPANTGDVQADLSRWAGDLAAALGSTRGSATLRMLTAAATEDPDTSRRLHEKFSGPLQEQANARLAAAEDLPTTAAQRRNAVDAIIGFMVFRVLAHQDLTRRSATDMARSVLRGLEPR
jgi:AcrR family transcriptional regulator